ncbi:MAG: hypothetical protein EB075_06910 [Bacteroidetes bacterium]|jgi:hypothetical protein|nr:hypothetical protein [Bacteroidota bacterium]
MAASTLFILWGSITVFGQTRAGEQPLMYSQQFRQAEAFIRVAEPDQLADTVYVWGDVNVPGAYIVPRTTSIVELLSFGRGPAISDAGRTKLSWYEPSLRITISSQHGENQSFTVDIADLHQNGLTTHTIHNGDLVMVYVTRPSTIEEKIRYVIYPLVNVTLSVVIALGLRNK